MASASDQRLRVLAVSSGGGHWTELMRIRSAFEGHEVVYATVQQSYQHEVPGARFHTVRDATRWNRVGLMIMACQLLLILLRERPDVVVSTGAAPGYAAIRIARWLRARTIWLDSMANVEELSMSGRLAGPHADLWLTQWAHLASPDGPEYAGAVL